MRCPDSPSRNGASKFSRRQPDRPDDQRQDAGQQEDPARARERGRPLRGRGPRDRHARDGGRGWGRWDVVHRSAWSRGPSLATPRSRINDAREHEPVQRGGERRRRVQGSHAAADRSATTRSQRSRTSRDILALRPDDHRDPALGRVGVEDRPARVAVQAHDGEAGVLETVQRARDVATTACGRCSRAPADARTAAAVTPAARRSRVTRARRRPPRRSAPPPPGSAGPCDPVEDHHQGVGWERHRRQVPCPERPTAARNLDRPRDDAAMIGRQPVQLLPLGRADGDPGLAGRVADRTQALRVARPWRRGSRARDRP